MVDTRYSFSLNLISVVLVNFNQIKSNNNNNFFKFSFHVTINQSNIGSTKGEDTDSVVIQEIRRHINIIVYFNIHMFFNIYAKNHVIISKRSR